MSAEQQTSKYLPIWKQLKDTGSCRITAPPIYHKKIIKAVKKRRDKDLAFLYQLQEDHRKHKIKYTINGSVIEFILIKELQLHIGAL